MWPFLGGIKCDLFWGALNMTFWGVLNVTSSALVTQFLTLFQVSRHCTV